MKSDNRLSKNNEGKGSSNGHLIYGRHPFFSVLKSDKRKVYAIFVSNKNKSEFFNIVGAEGISIDDSILHFVDNPKLDSIFPYKQKNHQGFILFVGRKKEITFDDFVSSINVGSNLPKLLILDQIVDPHNLGAIIRTAVAFGISDIILTSYNSVKDTSTVSKTSVGLDEFVNLITVINLNNAIRDLKKVGYFIVGLDGGAKNTIDQINDSRNLALVLGNEGRGIRELVKKNCDDLVRIDMKNSVESLNVSVASAIAIYALWR